MPRRVQWDERPRPCQDPDTEIVWISVKKLDPAWRSDDDYIGRGGTGAVIDDRYERFGAWLDSHRTLVEPPVVSLNENGTIGFTDGRHRFAWLRDHGIRSLPVEVPIDQAAVIRKYFGTTDTRSVFPADSDTTSAID